MTEIGMSGYLNRRDMLLDHLKARCRDVIDAQAQYIEANPYAEEFPDPLTEAVKSLSAALDEADAALKDGAQ